MAALSDTILNATPSGQLSGQRTYSVGGITAAQRTSNGASDDINVVVTDPINGTITATIDTTTAMDVDRRYTDPYGRLRGTHTSWPADVLTSAGVDPGKAFQEGTDRVAVQCVT